jgi:hypothetical protein
MQSTQVNEFSSATSLLQVGSYFDIIDNAVKTGDTNKRYTMSTNSATAPSPPIRNGSFTSFVISPTADNMCDLYNSFIEARLKIIVKTGLTVSANVYGTYVAIYDEVTGNDLGAAYTQSVWPDNSRSVWVGYKDSMDAIESYQIIVNGQSIYTQNYAIEESYITNLASTDAVKRTDIFSKARHSDVWNNVDTVRTGALVTFTDILNSGGSALIDYPAGSQFELTIPLKIDIRRFLPLSNVKYLPKFVGNFELRVKFSPAGLVCAPLPITDVFQSAYNKNKVLITGKSPKITSCFVPLGKKFTMLGSINGVNPAELKVIVGQTLTITSYEVTECSSVLHSFGLDSSIYQALMQRYSQTALAFPTQTLSFQPMTGNLNQAGSLSLTLTSTPRFVDSIFILFPMTN